MEIFTLVLFGILLLVFAAGFYLLFKKINSLVTSLKGEDILKQLGIHKAELGESLRNLHDRVHAISIDVGGVRDVTSQLREFQESLRSQKERGSVGEAILNDLLRQVLPTERYETQYELRTAGGVVKVDVVIKTSAGVLIPVDSKFPVEGFQRFSSAQGEQEKERAWREFRQSVRKRMEEVFQYIQPGQNTSPFALMYIPFEPIFQEVISDSELWQHALAKRVYFTSPQTFWIMLQLLSEWVKKQKFAEQVEDVLQGVQAVSKDAEDSWEELQKAAKHMSDAKNSADRLVSLFSSLLQKLGQLEELKAKPKDGKAQS